MSSKVDCRKLPVGPNGDPVTWLRGADGGLFDAAGDFDRLLRWDDQKLVLLRYVDPYGNTVVSAVRTGSEVTT